MVPVSVLDLAFVTQGATPADALHNSLDLARHVERWGYRRFWLAEHHNMAGIASAATSVAIGYVAGNGDSPDRKSTRLNSSHQIISYAVFCLKKKKQNLPSHENRIERE